ncbi:MAG: serine/threonine-protein phosphatase [Prevotella sp.]|nr:serine/threonine-protein phosphatase [Prevotella sp.]
MKISISQPEAIYQLGHRKNQEDCIYPSIGQAGTSTCLFLLCDGMGGHEHGEVASRAVAQAIAGVLEPCFNEGIITDEQVQQAVDEAYRQLDSIDDGSLRRAGTTMTLLALHKGGATAAHIGDSRIYHFRPRTGTILYMSRDHSLVYELYQAGEISFDEMKTHPRKNIITRAVMPGADNKVQPDIMHTTDLMPGDYFLLCSDGIIENITDQELLTLFSEDISDEEKCRKLTDLTADNADNHSAYIVRIDGVETEPGDEDLANDEQTAHFNAMHIHPMQNNIATAGYERTKRPSWLKRFIGGLRTKW